MKNLKPLIIYFSLSYFFSWIVFILLALNHHKIIFLFTENTTNARIADIWHAFGALGPFLSAVITLRYLCIRYQWNQFIKGYSISKINTTGWLLSLSPLIYFIVAIVANGIITQHWFSLSEFLRTNELLSPFNFLAWLLPSLFYGFFEEAGWRGFALPSLQKKYSAFTSTVIITIFWVGWHIPSFFYRYNMNAGALIGFVFGILAGAISLTFIFNYTKGSILAVSFWHLTYDLVSMICKEGMIPAIVSTLIMIVAIIILIKYKGKNLSPYERITWKIEEQPITLTP